MKEDREHKNNKKEDLGEQILQVIEDSINSMDFSGLSDGIRDLVDYAKDETQKQWDYAREKLNQWEPLENGGHTKTSKMERNDRRNTGNRSKMEAGNRGTTRNDRDREVPTVPQTRGTLPGTYSGPLQTGFGGAGLAIFGALSLGFGIGGFGLAAVSGIFSTVAVILESIFLPLTVISGIFLGRGLLTGKRTRRIKSYVRAWKDSSYIMLEDLVKCCGVPLKTVRKDVHFIMEHRWIPQARLDEKETCLMLTEEAGRQYDAAVESRKEREQKEQEEELLRQQWEMAGDDEKKLYRMEKESRKYLEELQKRKASISSLDVLDKINRLEMSISRIFVCVKEHPEKVSQTDRLMEYYIPSIMKLLRVYEELEKQPIQGDNIKKTTKEITDSLDTMNQALETMFDDMFQDIAIDISSDIQVLETMLAKDGWKKQELVSRGEKQRSIWE